MRRFHPCEGCVKDELDLVEMAYQFSVDNKAQVEQWLADRLMALVSDRQAIDWLARRGLAHSKSCRPDSSKIGVQS